MPDDVKANPPKSFFKRAEGNLMEKVVLSKDEETIAREQGFKPLKELFPG